MTRLRAIPLLLLLLGLPAWAQPVELTFTYWGSPFEREAVEAMVQAFNESHPDIRVRAQHIPDAYEEKMSTMLAGGTPPDVAYLNESQALNWAQEGVLEDLTPFFREDPEASNRLEAAYYNYDGDKTIGTNTAAEIMILYYNEQLFDDAGVAYPPADAAQAWTWDAFVETAKKLTKDRNGNDATSPDFDPENIDVYGVSFPQWWGGYLPFILSNGGNLASDDGTELLLNQPEAVEALQAMQDLIYVHHVAPTPAQSQTLPAADIMMQSRKVAMSIDGMWKVTDFSQLGFDWGMGVLPYFDEPVTVVLSTPKVIFSATEHPDEAFEFYTYISDPEQNDLFTGGLWSPLEERYFTDPEYTRVWLEGQEGVYPPEAQQVLVDYTLNNAPYQPATYWLRNTGQIFSEAINPAMTLLWAGEATAQEAMDQAVEDAAPLMQGRW